RASDRPHAQHGGTGIAHSRRGAGLHLRLGRRLLVVGLAAILALAPRAVWAHAVLFGSDPSPDAVLRAPPASISLTFSETVIRDGHAAWVRASSAGSLDPLPGFRPDVRDHRVSGCVKT